MCRSRVLGTTRKAYTVAVDRFGGHVAFADDEDRIHVVPTGFPAAALTTLDTDTAEVPLTVRTPARPGAGAGGSASPPLPGP